MSFGAHQFAYQLTINSTFQRELVSLHVGQTGVRIGGSLWQQICEEQSVQPDGKPVTTGYHGNLDTMFSESSGGKVTPRCVFTDLEPSIVQEVQRSPEGGLYGPESFVTGKEDGAHFSRGYYSVGRGHSDQVMEHIRKQVEQCDSLQGILITTSIGGGTGSGFTSLLNHRIYQSYRHTTKLQFSVFPSPHISPVILEPYNAVLHMNNELSTSDDRKMTVMFENESLYKICTRQGGMELPSYSDLNNLVARTISSVTAPIRFTGPITCDLNTIQTNIVPYPRISYTVASLVDTNPTDPSSVADMTSSCFSPDTATTNLTLPEGKLLSTCLLYRGVAHVGQINSALAHVRSLRTLKTTSWVPCPFKVGITNTPDQSVLSMCALSNHTGIESTICSLNTKYDRLYARRAFLYWYHGEGMESGEFSCAREEMAAWESDYTCENRPYGHWYNYRYAEAEDENSSESGDSGVEEAVDTAIRRNRWVGE